MSLLFNIAVNKLPMQLSMVMGRSFSGRAGSPLFLYKGLITSINQDSGMFPVSRLMLNSFIYIGKRRGQDILIFIDNFICFRTFAIF